MRLSLILYLFFHSGVRAEDVFDYAIVGGGTSGLTVASRLSEDPGVSVAVIEPGSDTRGIPAVESIDVFGTFIQNLGTYLDWQYNSIPQPGANNKTLGFSAGKAVGGTSTINGKQADRRGLKLSKQVAQAHKRQA